MSGPAARIMLSAGIHRDVLAEAYHADPAPEPSLSSSIAAEIVARSPLHGWTAHPRLNPAFEPQEAARLDIGSVAHELLLGRGRGISVLDFDDYRTKAAKAAREEARANGETPILAKYYEAASRMVESARLQLAGIPGCKDFFTDKGQSEIVLIWQNAGIWKRAMVDWTAADASIVVDYKTTTNANPEVLGRKIATDHYDLRASHYMHGFDTLAAELAGRRKFMWVFQEVEPPHALSVIARDATFAAMGDRKLLAAEYAWREGITKGRWPGYLPIVHTPDYPSYAESRWLDREAREADRRPGNVDIGTMLERSADAPPGYRHEARS